MSSQSPIDRIQSSTQLERQGSMDSVTSDQVDDIEETQCVCYGCYNFFSDPIQLGCGHRYCRQCLELYKENKTKELEIKERGKKKKTISVEFPCPDPGCVGALPPQRFWKVDSALQRTCLELIRLEARTFPKGEETQVKDVVEVMTEDFNDLDIQKVCTRRICQMLLMTDADSGLDVANQFEERTIRSMVAAILSHGDDWDVQKCAGITLSLVAIGSDKELRILLASNGGLFALLDTLKSVETDRVVAKVGSSAIRELIREDKDLVSTSKATLINVLTSVMATHLQCEEIQENGTYIFALLTECKAITASEANDDGIKEKLTPEESMIESVVNAMEAHPGCRGIQLAGSGLIGTVSAADWEDNRRVCFEAGSPDVLMKTLQTHIHDPVVLTANLFAIRMIVQHGETYDRFKELDLEKYVQIAKEKHTEEKQINDHIDDILYNMSDSWFDEKTILVVFIMVMVVFAFMYFQYSD